MNTAELITLLARNLEPVPRHSCIRWLVGLGGLGLMASACMLGLMFGLNPDLHEDLQTPMGRLKVLLPAAMAVAAFAAVHRLGRPGVDAGWMLGLVALGLGLWWVQGLVSWLQAPPLLRSEMLWGSTWRSCSLSIMGLALPMLAGLVMALKRLAPTRPALAGAVSGLLAGVAASALYALHCPELAAPFLALWYGLAISGMGLAGALAGARLLRW